MAYQPEQPNYDVGVYQIEATDPVDGGVGSITNSPLLNLADRTAYLYQQVTNLVNGTIQPPGMAPLNSPPLTGSPTTPTPPGGDNSTKVPNTAWTQVLVNGLSTINCAGSANVVLTAAQAGVGVLELTGILTGNISVIVPNSDGNWVVSNQTTGAFTITVKTAAGTGIAVTQGRTTILWSDGTNVYDAKTDFPNLALTGSPTAPTAASGDDSTKIANTAFVWNATDGAATVNVAGGASVTLTPAQYGSAILKLSGALTANINLVFPVQTGQWIVDNASTGAFTITCTTGSGNTIALPTAASCIVFCDGTNMSFVTPAVTTPAQFDDSTNVATTAFVQRALGNNAGQNNYTGSTTLTAADTGKTIVIQGGGTTTLPVASTVAPGTQINITAAATQITIEPQGTDTITLPTGTTAASISLLSQGTVTVGRNAAGTGWNISGGDASLQWSPYFNASRVSTGYQKLPGGLIIQWGFVTTSTSGYSNNPYPIAWPTGVLALTPSFENSTAANISAPWNGGSTPLTSFLVAAVSTAGSFVAGTVSWIAVGH